MIPIYVGYWGKKRLLIIFIVGILATALTYFFGSKEAFNILVFINIVFWIGFFMGLEEGKVYGVYIQDKEPPDAVGGNDNVKPRGPEDYL